MRIEIIGFRATAQLSNDDDGGHRAGNFVHLTAVVTCAKLKQVSTHSSANANAGTVFLSLTVTFDLFYPKINRFP